jgi:malate dehydrogenase (oxaloacetate-decarboxylating)
VSTTVALTVVEAALEEGLAGVELGDIVKQMQDAMWQPEYCRLRASCLRRWWFRIYRRKVNAG